MSVLVVSLGTLGSMNVDGGEALAVHQDVAQGIVVQSSSSPSTTTTNSTAGTTSTSICWDAQGIWTIPDGMIVGGLDDNTADPAYSIWYATCDLEMTAQQLTVEVRLSEVLADYEECVAQHAEDAAYRTATLPPDPHEPIIQLVAGNGEEDCGQPPVPPAQATPQGGDLVWTVDVDADHLGRKDGSITYSSYSYKAKDAKDKAGPINVVFYGNGDVDDAISGIRTDSHFQSTVHHCCRCGGPKHAYIWDKQHTGSDSWHTSHWDTRQSEAHHSNAGAYHCDNARTHIRHYGASNLKDNHSPSFGYYSIANSHYEGHNHKAATIDHQAGANHVGDDMRAAGYTVSYWRSPNNGQNVALIRVP